MVSVTVLYFTVFAFASLFYSKFQAPNTRKTARFLIVVPCFKADDLFDRTLQAIYSQHYDSRSVDILVVSSGNKPITNMKLAQHNLALHIMPEAEYTDVRSWQFAMQNCPPLRIYDLVLIVEAGETFGPAYLLEINEAFQLGSKAIQTHRTYRKRETTSEIMHATFEEINSSIFRMGHVALGFSSGLLGSGMAFEYRWFRDNIGRLPQGSDLKAFEAMVFESRKYVYFLDETRFFSKPQTDEGTSRVLDRSSWMYAQWHALRTHLHLIPRALVTHNTDLVDKIFQWSLMPRIVMMSIISLMCLITPWFWWSMAVKWFLSGVWIVFVYAIATPDYLVNREWEKAYLFAPLLMLKAFFYALPSGWALVFTRKHKDEWRNDLIEQHGKLKEQGEKLLERGGQLVGRGGQIAEDILSHFQLGDTTDAKEEQA